MVGNNHRVAEMSIRYGVDASSSRLQKYHISLSMRINQFHHSQKRYHIMISRIRGFLMLDPLLGEARGIWM